MPKPTRVRLQHNMQDVGGQSKDLHAANGQAFEDASDTVCSAPPALLKASIQNQCSY